MKTITTAKTLDVLRRLFSSYGLPEEIVSDNGPQFTSNECKECMDRNGIKHTRVAPYHPASNGAAERTVQIVKRALIKQLLDPNPKKQHLSIHHKLANFLIMYRNTPQTTTGRTPAELFLKRQPRTRFSLLKPNLAQKVESKQEKQRTYHDQGRVKERTLQVDQKVRVKSHENNLVKWLPGKVVKVCGPRTYIVHVYKNGKNRYVHIDHIFPSQEENQSESVEEVPSYTTSQELAVHLPTLAEQETTTEEKIQEESQITPQSMKIPVRDSQGSTVQQTNKPDTTSDIYTENSQRRYPQRNRKAPDRLDL